MTSSSSPKAFSKEPSPGFAGVEVLPDLELSRLGEVVFRRRWLILWSVLICLAAALFYLATTAPIFSATALILIDKEEKGRVLADAPLVETKADDYYRTQYRLLKSRSLIKRVYDGLELHKVPEFRDSGPGGLAAAVIVTPISGSRLVNLTAESTDPALAARIANSLAEFYVAQNLESKLFISKEILQALQSRIDGDSDLEEKYNSLPAVVNNPLVQDLKTRFAGLEARWGDVTSRYTAEHPERIRLKAEMAAVQDRIREETLRAVKGMKAELSGQLLGNNVRIVDPAEVPGSPSKPRRAPTVLLSVAVGLIAGIVAALVIENLDQTVHTQEDIERRIRLPFLGAVSYSLAFKGETSRDFEALLKGPESFTSESLKNIRTMIGFAAAAKGMKKFLVTSTVQGEGKTFLAINLALVFAQLGQKVLLIEGDLRRPNLHKRFGLPKEKGLSHFLAYGKDASEAAGLIHQSGQPNLDILHCGSIPPNPAELLSTPRLQGMVQWAAGKYDQVIIDGTPVFPVTDALLWSQVVDGAIFVVRFGAVHSGLSVKACQKLSEGGLPIIGAVLNQVTWKGGAYGDYYSYYYYHYSKYSEGGKKEGA